MSIEQVKDLFNTPGPRAALTHVKGHLCPSCRRADHELLGVQDIVFGAFAVSGTEVRVILIRCLHCGTKAAVAGLL